MHNRPTKTPVLAGKTSVLAGAACLIAACAGGSDGSGAAPPGSGGPLDPPAGLDLTTPGLTGAVAGVDTLRVDHRLPATGFDAALFLSNDPAAVFAGAPAVIGLQGDHTLLSGLAPGQDVFMGLGLRPESSADGGTGFLPLSPVLRVRTRPPVFVDAGANPAVADGTTPQTAFPDLFPAVLSAILQGGGNLWIRAGDYDVGALVILSGVDLYGGFTASFDLADRDPATSVTTLRGTPGAAVVTLEDEGGGAILDGLHIDGENVASFGLDLSDTPVEIRSTRVERCAGSGLHLRNGGVSVIDVLVAGSSVTMNGADGLSGAGPFRLIIDGSRFDGNVQEGVDLDDLIAPEGGEAVLQVRGSGFFGNGTQGLDADLAAPLVHGAGGGTFTVTVESCAFELNGDEGLLLDQDHELDAGWRADLVVRECLTRANGTHGVRIDADAESTILVHRLLAVGNAGDGLWVSSESNAGLALVSTSAAFGNLGAGLRASIGNKPIVASHCVLAGNAAGGFVSETVESAAVSSVAYLQPTPWTGVRQHFTVDAPSPLPPTFVNAPEAFAVVIAQTGGGQLQLSANPGLIPGVPVELADDGIERMLTSSAGTSVTVAPAPALFLTPGTLAAFAPAAPVAEDLQLAPGSSAAGAGMTPPGGTPIDAGVFGSPTAGVPGVGDGLAAPLFRVAATTPPLVQPVGPATTIRVRFEGGTLDPASLAIDAVGAVTAAGTPLAISFFADGDELAVVPPSEGWGTELFVLELHGLIRALDGTPLCVPVALPHRP